MLCKNCKTKNENNSKFCYKCGKKLTNNKFSNLDKKNKIVMGIVLIIILIAFIILGILLNNPLKRVEDALNSYYYNYNDTKELEEIGKVLKSNKNDKEVLEKIENTTDKAVDKWVKNFNKMYKNKEELDKEYDRISSILKNIYEYFNGLEYMIDREEYETKSEELKDLYYSKYAYFDGLENENKKNDYYAYYYYFKVIEKDCYYKKAQEYINNYTKEACEEVLNEAREMVKDGTLDSYLDAIDYLDDNKNKDNIDLSSNDDYKNLYIEFSKAIVNLTKEECEKVEDTNKKIEIINKSLDALDSDTEEYKELEDYKKTIENTLPESILKKDNISKTVGSDAKSTSKIIDTEEYTGYISFKSTGNKEAREYKLNKEYKKFKAIVKAGDFKGEIVIYGDDKELFRESVSDKEIDIDVSNVDILKIEVKSLDVSDNYIYLVEPYLYR